MSEIAKDRETRANMRDEHDWLLDKEIQPDRFGNVVYTVYVEDDVPPIAEGLHEVVAEWMARSWNRQPLYDELVDAATRVALSSGVLSECRNPEDALEASRLREQAIDDLVAKVAALDSPVPQEGKS